MTTPLTYFRQLGLRKRFANKWTNGLWELDCELLYIQGTFLCFGAEWPFEIPGPFGQSEAQH